jgi:hypothetical protein
MINVRRLKEELLRRRVAVYRVADSAWIPIPVALTATVVTASDWKDLERDARMILGAFPKIQRWLCDSRRQPLLERLYEGLTGLEMVVSKHEPEVFWGHATIRMDLFWHQDAIKVIEVNCTIPAMQAYSDNVFGAWTNAGGEAESESNNVGELLNSLLSLYRGDGGMLSRPRIAILHRQGDSQLGELLWLKREWSRMGFETLLATPETLSRAGDLWLVGGIPCDLVYRHIFAWRLEKSAVANALMDNRRFHIYNPASAHYESKGFLALLSHLASTDDMARDADLTEDEIRAIRHRVPWSRLLGRLDNAVPFQSVESRLAGLVLKRSVGYGGHQVFMGDAWDSDETQARLRHMTSLVGHISFATFAAWAETRDTSLWIAQERMSGARRKTQVLTANGIETWNAWYDASLFLNTKGSPICHGGVSRVATTPVVNIGTGGGLAPFVIV